MSEESSEYELWFEFERWDQAFNPGDVECDFFFMGVSFADGREYSLNVWTYAVLPMVIEKSRQEGDNLNGLYMEPPDLFVARMDKETCERVMHHLIEHGLLQHQWAHYDPHDFDDDYAGELEDEVEPNPPVDLDAHMDYRLEWNARFRLNRASKIERLTTWLSRELGCALNFLDYTLSEGVFDVRLETIVPNANAMQVFWMVNQWCAKFKERRIVGPDVDAKGWSFQIEHSNPKRVPSLESFSVRCHSSEAVPCAVPSLLEG